MGRAAVLSVITVLPFHGHEGPARLIQARLDTRRWRPTHTSGPGQRT